MAGAFSTRSPGSEQLVRRVPPMTNPRRTDDGLQRAHFAIAPERQPRSDRCRAAESVVATPVPFRDRDPSATPQS